MEDRRLLNQPEVLSRRHAGVPFPQSRKLCFDQPSPRHLRSIGGAPNRRGRSPPVGDLNARKNTPRAWHSPCSARVDGVVCELNLDLHRAARTRLSRPRALFNGAGWRAVERFSDRHIPVSSSRITNSRSGVRVDKRRAHALSGQYGNYYWFNSRNVRTNVQIMNIDRSPVSSVFGFYVGGRRASPFRRRPRSISEERSHHHAILK